MVWIAKAEHACPYIQSLELIVQDVALPVALDNLDDFPIAESIQICVAIYADFAYDCFVEVAG